MQLMRLELCSSRPTSPKDISNAANLLERGELADCGTPLHAIRASKPVTRDSGTEIFGNSTGFAMPSWNPGFWHFRRRHHVAAHSTHHPDLRIRIRRLSGWSGLGLLRWGRYQLDPHHRTGSSASQSYLSYLTPANLQPRS